MLFRSTELIGAMFRKSYGQDTDTKALTYANVLHKRAGTIYQTAPKKPADPVDFVTLIEVIEHMTVGEGDETLKRIAEWMHPEGEGFITTPVAKTKDGTNPGNPWHIHEYQPAELMELVRRHFQDARGKVDRGCLHAIFRGPKL